MSDCEHCRNHWCCELEYKDKCEHCFFENPTDEYNATFTQEYKYGYQQGRADAIDELKPFIHKNVKGNIFIFIEDYNVDKLSFVEQLKEQSY